MSYYEINIAQNGYHFFATAPRSVESEKKAKEVYKTLKEKFPVSEGYSIIITYYPQTGQGINLTQWDKEISLTNPAKL